ncbi:hypothetical protein Tco_0854217 [Tanacetum coccineum]
MVLSFLNEVLIGVKGEEEECVVFYVDFAKAYKLGFVGTSCLTSLRLLDFGSDLVSLGLEVALLMENKFRYLGVMVGAGMTRHKAWDDVVLKLQSRLSKWKAKTLSIGGRLTLLKSVLGASPLYNMSSFKVPKGVLKVMESKFVVTSLKVPALGLAFVSQDDSLWFRLLSNAFHGDKIDSHSVRKVSHMGSILRKFKCLSHLDLISCRIALNVIEGCHNLTSFMEKRLG